MSQVSPPQQLKPACERGDAQAAAVTSAAHASPASPGPLDMLVRIGGPKAPDEEAALLKHSEHVLRLTFTAYGGLQDAWAVAWMQGIGVDDETRCMVLQRVGSSKGTAADPGAANCAGSHSKQQQGEAVQELLRLSKDQPSLRFRPGFKPKPRR